MSAPLPLLFVTGHAPPSRVEPFRLLAERENVVFALFGGRSHHAVAGVEDLPFPVLRVSQREVGALASSGDYRAVICGTGGRVALPAAFTGARRAGVPFVLWASLWAHPRSVAGLLGYPVLRRIYRTADAVVTYGLHVSAYVRERGATEIEEAPQAVDNDFWSETVPGTRLAPFQVVFAGRLERAKGTEVLARAWTLSGLDDEPAALVLVGEGPEGNRFSALRMTHLVGPQPADGVRNFYGAADVVVVPSIPTRTFKEPWGLVTNEAMNQATTIIASDAVGAAAGGLVRHERNGLIVPSADPQALASALRRLYEDPGLRARLGESARADVRPYSHQAWVDGVSRALHRAAASKEDC